MTLYPYSRQTTFDPNTQTIAGGVGQVYAIYDVDRATPLPTVDANRFPVTLVANENTGYLPDFWVEDHTEVVFRSGDWEAVLVTTMAVKGEKGEPGEPGPVTVLPPGEVEDETVAPLIADPRTSTRAALNAATVEVVNPRARLVLGRGSTSMDRTELQNAVTDASASGAPLLVRGNFQLDGQINAPGPVVVDADDSVITQTKASSPVWAVRSDSRVSGGVIHGLGTDWQHSTAVYAANAVQLLAGATNVTVENIVADNLAGAGVYAPAAGRGLRVINCTFTGLGSSVIPPEIGQYGGGLVANNLEDFHVIGGTFSGFPMGIVTGQAKDFYIGAGVDLSSVGQHGIYLGNAVHGTISGARIHDMPLQGIKVQIANSVPNDTDLLTIGDVNIWGQKSHGILLDNVATTKTGRARRVSIHDVMVDHGGAGDTILLQYVDGVNVHDVRSRGGVRGLRAIEATNIIAHHMEFVGTRKSGVFLNQTTDANLDHITVRDGGLDKDPNDGFGFFVSGASSARIRFDANQVVDGAGNYKYGFYVAAGDIGSMGFTNNRSGGVSDYGYRAHASTATEIWAGNDLRGTLGRFLTMPPNATTIPNTTGVTLAALEAEVNKLKQRLRDIHVVAP